MTFCISWHPAIQRALSYSYICRQKTLPVKAALRCGRDDDITIIQPPPSSSTSSGHSTSLEVFFLADCCIPSGWDALNRNGKSSLCQQGAQLLPLFRLLLFIYGNGQRLIVVPAVISRQLRLNDYSVY